MSKLKNKIKLIKAISGYKECPVCNTQNHWLSIRIINNTSQKVYAYKCKECKLLFN